MALDKVIDSAQLDADLTAVAYAIRTKGGITEQLSFPDGFVSAVEGIQDGGGGVSEQDLIEACMAGTWPSGDVTVHGRNIVPGFSNTPATSLHLAEALKIPDLRGWKAVTKLNAPCATSIDAGAFMSHVAIKEVYAPSLLNLANNCFRDCKALEIVVTSASGTNNVSSAFRQSRKLKKVDGCFAYIGGGWFYDTNTIQHLVLRKNSLTNLTDAEAFYNTPYVGYNGLVGYCYVPRTLISEYQVATNWSLLYEAGTCIFRALEDYTIDGTTTGEMDWTRIEAEGA